AILVDRVVSLAGDVIVVPLAVAVAVAVIVIIAVAVAVSPISAVARTGTLLPADAIHHNADNFGIEAEEQLFGPQRVRPSALRQAKCEQHAVHDRRYGTRVGDC